MKEPLNNLEKAYLTILCLTALAVLACAVTILVRTLN